MEVLIKIISVCAYGANHFHHLPDFTSIAGSVRGSHWHHSLLFLLIRFPLLNLRHVYRGASHEVVRLRESISGFVSFCIENL